MFSVPLNIFFDSIRNYSYDSFIDIPSQKAIWRVSLLQQNSDALNPNCLYIGKLSEAMKHLTNRSTCTFFCLRDRIKDASEDDALLDGCVIINENIPLDAFFNQMQEVFLDVYNWVNDMQNAVIQNQSLSELLELSTQIIGNYIAISDSALKLITYTKNIPCDDPVCKALRENGYHPESTVSLFRKTHRFEKWEKENFYIDDGHEVSRYTIVGKVFQFRNTYFIHSVMTCNNKEVSPGLLDLYKILLDYVGIYAARDWEKTDAYSHNYDSFFTDLLEGNLNGNRQIIRERAKYLKITPSGIFNLVQISLDPSGNYSSGRIGQELSDLLPTAKIMLYHQHIVIINFFDDKRFEDQLEALKEKLNCFLERYNLFAGISSLFYNIDEIQYAYKQCQMTLKHAGWFSDYPSSFHDLLLNPESASVGTNRLFFFDDAFLLFALNTKDDFFQLWRRSIYGRALIKLHHYDCNHGTNNLQLLYVYLSCDQKPSVVGEILHLHRNTIVYRIEKLQEIIDISLENAKNRLSLFISCVLYRIWSTNQQMDYDDPDE